MKRIQPHYAQAFLVTSNLPPDLDGLLEWVADDPDLETPVERVFYPVELTDSWTYTAPARVGNNDVAFFHFAARAEARVKSLRNAARKAGELDGDVEFFLDNAEEIAAKYAGRIFAYGILSGPAEPVEPDKGRTPHWRSRLYAPFAAVHRLRKPLLLREHHDVLPQPYKAITDLTAAQFASVKERLTLIGNRLTADLTHSLPGRDDFHGISADTWRQFSCDEAAQFRSEADLRGFYADYLLGEIKDPGTDICAEARCVAARPKRRLRKKAVGRPRADYVVSIAGEWVPVETKLSLWTWPDIFEQVRQYIGVDTFEVRLPGRSVNTLPAGSTRACIVIDKDGLYVVREDSFVDCDFGRPAISRLDMGQIPAKALRKRVAALIGR